MKSISVSLVLLLFLATSCTKDNSGEKVNSENQGKLSKAELIVQETIDAHGGSDYDTAAYAFTFRNKQYTFSQGQTGTTYTVTSNKDGKQIVDKLENNTFSRTIDSETTQLSLKEINSYTESLNSVIYFATLPYKLKDEAVNKTDAGTTTIKGQDYQVIAVTFEKEGGGQDHDDEFHYWINSATKRIDYLAYKYQVNEGGVRFRSAYNTRNVDGILFQDYVNYKAPIGMPLADLPALFEKGELEELSKIETENVINLNNNK